MFIYFIEKRHRCGLPFFSTTLILQFALEDGESLTNLPRQSEFVASMLKQNAHIVVVLKKINENKNLNYFRKNKIGSNFSIRKIEDRTFKFKKN